MSENRIAKRILGELDRTVVPTMKKKSIIVKEFVDALQDEIRRQSKTPLSPLNGATIIHGGSAYEGLVVSEDVDFDIIVISGKPYLSENFIVHRECNKFFTLKWKSIVKDKGFRDEDGYLHVALFRRELFYELKQRIKAIQLSGMEITINEGTAALILEFKHRDGYNISMDLVPHIAFHSWDQCPDLKALEEMPFDLRNHIENLIRNASPTMFFNLAVPGFDGNSRLCNVSFAVLEKKFVTSDVKVRSMARLAKFVGYRCGWKDHGFQSYYVKRMAVKHYDSLKHLDVWDGYQAILQYLKQELRSRTIDGYFIKDQETYMGNASQAEALVDKISDAMAMTADNVEGLLDNDSSS